MAHEVDKGTVRAETNSVVRVLQGERIEAPGRGGRTALVDSVRCTWHWTEEDGWRPAWKAQVRQSDVLRSGRLGTPYSTSVSTSNPHRRTVGLEGVDALIELGRPTVVVRLEQQ